MKKIFFFFQMARKKLFQFAFDLFGGSIEVVSNCVELSLNFSSKFAEEVSLELSVKSVKLSRER